MYLRSIEVNLLAPHDLKVFLKRLYYISSFKVYACTNGLLNPLTVALKGTSFNIEWSTTLASFPGPLPLNRTASDGKLGAGLGTRLVLPNTVNQLFSSVVFRLMFAHSKSFPIPMLPATLTRVSSQFGS